MVKTELEWQCAGESDGRAGGIPVVIVAGGRSTRMGGLDKVLVELMGIPVLVRAMQAFERNAHIGRIVLVVREDLMADASRLAKQYMIGKLTDVITGGDDRLTSVKNGLDALADYDGPVLIHDGARPLLTDEVIDRVTDAPSDAVCVVCGVPLKDTVKQVNGETVEKTLNRNHLLAVQTPQRLSAALYKGLLDTIHNSDLYTDDASVMEAAGYSVLCVPGDETNIKLTTPADLCVAECYLRESLT